MGRQSMVKAGDPDDLTELEARLVERASEPGSIEEISEAAGFSDPAGARLALRRDPVKKAIKAHRQTRLETDYGNMALRTLKELMGKETPPAQRFAAAKWVLEAAGHGAAHVQPAGEKAIGDMSTAELERFIKEAAKLADPALAKPVIDHVAPDDGALNPTPGQGGAQKP